MFNFSVLAAIDSYPSSGMVVLIGVVVVFSVLLLLTSIFWFFGKAVGGTQKKETPAPIPVKKPAVAPAPAPVVSGDVSDEVVAVIAAAVAAMSADGTEYVIRRIRPAVKTANRPAWGTAGIAENTRPF